MTMNSRQTNKTYNNKNPKSVAQIQGPQPSLKERDTLLFFIPLLLLPEML